VSTASATCCAERSASSRSAARSACPNLSQAAGVECQSCGLVKQQTRAPTAEIGPADTVLALHRACAAVRLFDVCGGCRQQGCWADNLHGMRPQHETYGSSRAAKYAQHNECQRTARKVHLAAQAEAVEPSSDLRHTFAPLASSAETSACRPRPAAAISAVAPGPRTRKVEVSNVLQQACSAEASAWRPRPVAAVSAIAPGGAVLMFCGSAAGFASRAGSSDPQSSIDMAARPRDTLSLLPLHPNTGRRTCAPRARRAYQRGAMQSDVEATQGSSWR